MGVFLQKIDDLVYNLQRSFRSRLEQLSIALAIIFPSDGW